MIGTYDDPRPKAPQMPGYQLVASGKSFAYYRPETSDRHASRLAHHQLLIEAWTGKTDAALPGADIIDISPVTEKIDKL